MHVMLRYSSLFKESSFLFLTKSFPLIIYELMKNAESYENVWAHFLEAHVFWGYTFLGVYPKSNGLNALQFSNMPDAKDLRQELLGVKFKQTEL